MKHSSGKLPLPGAVRDWLPSQLEFHGLQRLPWIRGKSISAENCPASMSILRPTPRRAGDHAGNDDSVARHAALVAGGFADVVSPFSTGSRSEIFRDSSFSFRILPYSVRRERQQYRSLPGNTVPAPSMTCWGRITSCRPCGTPSPKTASPGLLFVGLAAPGNLDGAHLAKALNCPGGPMAISIPTIRSAVRSGREPASTSSRSTERRTTASRM